MRKLAVTVHRQVCLHQQVAMFMCVYLCTNIDIQVYSRVELGSVCCGRRELNVLSKHDLRCIPIPQCWI